MPQLPDGTYPKAKGAPVFKDASLLFNEELRHFSNNIAKDCDEAFRCSLIEDESFTGSVADVDRKQRDSTPLSFTIDTPSEATAPSEFSNKSWSTRPLPPLPSEIAFPSQQTTAVNSRPASRAEDRDTLVEQIDRLALPLMLSNKADRRVVSAPAYGHVSRRTGTLPCISENPVVTTANAEKTRIVSAPPQTPSNKAKRPMSGVDYLNNVETSIRVVNSPSALSPVKIPEPLNVRKKPTKESLVQPLQIQRKQREHIARDHEHYAQDAPQSGNHSPVKKKKSWFRRSFKPETDGETLAEPKDGKQRTVSCETRQSASSSTTANSSKKRNFSFPFWKSNRNRDSKIIEGMDDCGSISLLILELTNYIPHR
jgi:hypothetical protein